MKLLIDLQGAQALNSQRGIGRYSLSLAEAIVRCRGSIDVHVLLNERFIDSAVELRRRFAELLGSAAIHSFAPAEDAFGRDPDAVWRSVASECLREAVIARIAPDAVLVCSMFEGFADDAVASVHSLDRRTPIAVVLYDLIPHLFPSVYLTDCAMREWYELQLGRLVGADLLLSISEATRADAVSKLHLSPDFVVNISSAVDPAFSIAPNDLAWAPLAAHLGISRSLLLYTGGIDDRKNIDRLLAAYAALDESVRSSTQLAVVCAIEESTQRKLAKHCEGLGLREDEVIFTGFVSEHDLRLLYWQCTAFVFPSWYEGFGLPVLEAMSSGRAVIGANTSSIPEVIGRVDALFDPFDTESMAAAIERVLLDNDFRADLERTGLERSRLFTWDLTAQRALAAIEALAPQPVAITPASGRKRLAYVSPLPPLPSGISDYSAALIPHLLKYYDIELITADDRSDDLDLGCPIRSVEWFRLRHAEFDRVVYHIGNSEFHQHMFPLLATIPGVVVLHDFFLSSIMAHMDATGVTPGGFAEALYHSHGYSAIDELSRSKDLSDIIWRYPANLQTLQDADGVIVHSDFARRLVDEWYGAGAGDDWTVIPLLRNPIDYTTALRVTARKDLGIADDEFVVASFGLVGPTKLHDRLVDAFAASSLAADELTRLVIVGENNSGQYGLDLEQRLAAGNGRYQCTGRVDAATYRNYLLASDVAVQLRATSRGETSAAILDCLNAGVALIANANGAQADLHSDSVLLLPDDFTLAELAAALESLWENPHERARLAGVARQVVQSDHEPANCAARYYEAIERYSEQPSSRAQLRRAIAWHPMAATSRHDIPRVAAAFGHSLPPSPRLCQLFVDVSELAARDAESGIQRATKNILRQLLVSAPAGLRVEPVYASTAHGYRYARQFTKRFLGIHTECGDDDPIEFGTGDIFLGLDLQPLVITHHREFFGRLAAAGTSVQFVVYDLLPLLIPHAFYPSAAEFHTRWLRVVAEADQALCISQTVADEFNGWVEQHAPHRLGKLLVRSFPLGADLSSATPTFGFPAGAVDTLRALAARKTFTMVGTIEPRKAHEQTLEGFERLWQRGVDVNLAIVGKPGWLVDELLERLRSHPEFGHRLLWISGASDEFLNSVYQFSDCLIAASWAEGFGLPLVEARLHRLPVIARDIPVFRELAGDHAHYFHGSTGDAIEAAVLSWLDRDADGTAPASDGIPCVTWQDATARLVEHVLAAQHQRPASDVRLWV